MNLVFVAVAAVNVVSFVLGLLLNLHAFDDGAIACEARFGDQALVLATISALVLTTPWNFVITESPALNGSYKAFASPEFLISASIPITLLFLYLSIIVLALNGNELIQSGVCPSTNGRRGAYSALVWLDIFVFLHTVVIAFASKYRRHGPGTKCGL